MLLSRDLRFQTVTEQWYKVNKIKYVLGIQKYRSKVSWIVANLRKLTLH